MLRVMFIDDDRNILDGLRRMLRKMKDEWEMAFIEDAKEALEKLSKEKYDAVVCDYKMPGMNGLDLLTHVSSINNDTKRILLTGQSETEVFDSANKVVHHYISKPCSHEELIKIINTQLD